MYHGDDGEILLIYNNGKETICYQVDASGYDKWNVKWTYDNKGDETITDLLIVNDNLFQATMTGIDVLDVTNGELTYQLLYDINS